MKTKRRKIRFDRLFILLISLMAIFTIVYLSICMTIKIIDKNIKVEVVQNKQHVKKQRHKIKDINEKEEKETINNTYLGSFILTAYCPCYECSEGYGTMTASGVNAAAKRTIAVDPKIIPLGTKVLINGIEYIAEDVGGGVKGNHIDIYVDNHYETFYDDYNCVAEVYLVESE